MKNLLRCTIRLAIVLAISAPAMVTTIAHSNADPRLLAQCLGFCSAMQVGCQEHCRQACDIPDQGSCVLACEDICVFRVRHCTMSCRAHYLPPYGGD
jgi:hypothetical protein